MTVSLNLFDFKTSDYFIKNTHMLQGFNSNDGSTNANQDIGTNNQAGIVEGIYIYWLKYSVSKSR